MTDFGKLDGRGPRFGAFSNFAGKKKQQFWFDDEREKAAIMMRFSLDLKPDFRLWFVMERPRAASAGWVFAYGAETTRKGLHPVRSW
jgi:hypothetical protein